MAEPREIRVSPACSGSTHIRAGLVAFAQSLGLFLSYSVPLSLPLINQRQFRTQQLCLFRGLPFRALMCWQLWEKTGDSRRHRWDRLRTGMWVIQRAALSSWEAKQTIQSIHMPHRAQEILKLKPQKQKTGSKIELYEKKENGRVGGLTGGRMPCSASSRKRMYCKHAVFSCHFFLQDFPNIQKMWNVHQYTLT